ncbi:hypothetical protein, partial [Pseudomonas sp. FEN]
ASTTASICLDRLLRSAVQSARHANVRGHGASVAGLAPGAIALGQFLLGRWHPDGGHRPRQAGTESPTERRPLHHATLLVLCRLRAAAGVTRPCTAVAGGAGRNRSGAPRHGHRRPHTTPAMAFAQSQGLSTEL